MKKKNQCSIGLSEYWTPKPWPNDVASYLVTPFHRDVRMLSMVCDDLRSFWWSSNLRASERKFLTEGKSTQVAFSVIFFCTCAYACARLQWNEATALKPPIASGPVWSPIPSLCTLVRTSKLALTWVSFWPGLRWRQRKYQLISSKLLNYKLNHKCFRSGATIPSLEWLWSNAWVRCCVTAAQLSMMHKSYRVWTNALHVWLHSWNQSKCLLSCLYLCWLCSLIIGISRSNKHGSKLKLKLAYKMCNGFNLRHTM